MEQLQTTTTKVWVLLNELNSIKSGQEPSKWYITQPKHDNLAVELIVPTSQLNEWKQPPTQPKQLLFG
jgi:hypothetical protein